MEHPPALATDMGAALGPQLESLPAWAPADTVHPVEPSSGSGTEGNTDTVYPP